MWNLTQTRSRLLVGILAFLVFCAYYTIRVTYREKWTPVPTVKPMVVVEPAARQDLFSASDFNVPGDMGKLLVVSDLKTNYLVPPSPRDVAYNLDHPNVSDPSVVQAFLINRILRGKRNGFFIECGAYDGEYMSNTLMFERDYNWTGLLIEPSPPLYKKLSSKKRKAHLSPTCLSRSTYVETLVFENEERATSGAPPQDGEGGPNEKDQQSDRARLGENKDGGGNVKAKNATNETTKRVQCFPLYSYLLALNRKTVDYLSLDVEGFELHTLKTIPWDMVNIRTMSVQFLPQSKKEDRRALRSFMEGVGYSLNTEVVIRPDHAADDYIFVKQLEEDDL